MADNDDRDEARRRAAAKAATFFDDLWGRGDYWQLETAAYEAEKYDRQIALIDDATYDRILEIGCGAGAFTDRLARLGRHVVGLDVSAKAIARARARQATAGVEFRVANVMDLNLNRDTEEAWDLIVMGETIYYIGWLHTFFEVAWLGRRLFDATRPGGRLLLTNTLSATGEYLTRPWVIRTYHDLFGRVGFQLEAERVLQGSRNNVPRESLIALYRRPADSATAEGAA